MNTAYTYGDETATGAPHGTVVAAAFTERERAHDAAHQLHHEGFDETWIGIAKRAEPAASGDDYLADAHGAAYASMSNAAVAAGGETRVESENWFTRFFGEGDESLHDALVRHGVDEAAARAAGTVSEHSAILIVDGGNHPEMTAQIISECGGRLITPGFGATGYGTSGTFDSTSGGVEAPEFRTTSLIDDGANGAYDDYGRYRAGTIVDESTRLQLREERLRQDKSRIARGDAIDDLDLPPVREELFVERRPLSGSPVDGMSVSGQTEADSPAVLSAENVFRGR